MALYFDFKVTLQGLKSAPWRRFLLKDTATFLQLHRAIQDACGWMDCHLFEFIDAENHVLARSPEEEPDLMSTVATLVANRVKVRRHFHATGDACGYLYDFGDDWWHRVELCGLREQDGKGMRVLLDGRQAFPPEDCGGIPGYQACVRALKQPDKADPQFLEWLDDWRPDAFDLERVKLAFDQGRHPKPLRAGFWGV